MSESLTEFHPHTERLDRLRAGLLDDDPAGKNRLLAHLAACDPCRRRIEAWNGLARALNDAALDAPSLARELAARRRAALAGRSATRAAVSRAPRYALAATLAALLAGAGVFLALERPAERVAATAQAEMPDLYADLDFYLWLAREGARDEAAPDRS
jgi:hypothetical protein